MFLITFIFNLTVKHLIKYTDFNSQVSLHNSFFLLYNKKKNITVCRSTLANITFNNRICNNIFAACKSKLLQS